MSDTNLSLNPYPNDPEMADLAFEIDRGVKLTMNCHAIGVIKSFNKTLQTAVVQITYTRTSSQFDATTQTYIAVQTPYPPLMDCVLGFLGGGGANLQFPVTSGDECFVEFNDRDIDNWWASGGTTVQLNTQRLHDIADAIAWVGVRSKPNVIKNFDGSRVVLAGADSPTGARVGVSATVASLENGGPTGAKIAAAAKADIQVAGQSLGTAIGQLMTQLTTLNTALATFSVACEASVTDPILVTAATALTAALTPIGAALTTITTLLGSILA